MSNKFNESFAREMKRIAYDIPKEKLMLLVDKIIEGLRYLKRKILREQAASFSFSRKDLAERIDAAIITLRTAKPIIALETVKSKIADAFAKVMVVVYKALYKASPKVAKQFYKLVRTAGIFIVVQEPTNMEETAKMVEMQPFFMN